LYEWQKLPFVFAVWAAAKTMAGAEKSALKQIIAHSLDSCEMDFVSVAGDHGRRLGLTDHETQEYLAGFNYRLGEREREAMKVFRRLVLEIAAGPRKQSAERKGDATL
jgi:predicted solute-binding protein